MIVAARADQGLLTIDWEDGHRGLVSWRWLSDACGCPRCLVPGTMQRVARVWESAGPAGTPMDYVQGREGLKVVWSPGHEYLFPAEWLRENCGCVGCATARVVYSSGRHVLWDAADGIPRRWPYEEVRRDLEVRREWLSEVARRGVALLEGAPHGPGAVLEVAEWFGYVRETNYGRIFDIQVEHDPANLANTDLGLEPHTDNPYRDPVPTLQLLHCLSTASHGGETVLVDGAAIDLRLRAVQPEAHQALCGLPARWEYRDAYARLRWQGPVLEHDLSGNLRQIRWNERSRQPLPLTPADAGRFIDALAAFRAAAGSDQLQARFTLAPGDVLLFDNRRVLHGRTAYPAADRRHLQGCYADIDGLLSALEILEGRPGG